MEAEEVLASELEFDVPEEEWLLLRWVVAKDFPEGALEERFVEGILWNGEQYDKR